MASLKTQQQRHYDVLAEALTADGRVIKRVEARADNLADVAEAFILAGAEVRKAHLPPARVRLTASRAGITEIAVTDVAADEMGPLGQSALLDGKTKLDAPPSPQVKVREVTFGQSDTFPDRLLQALQALARGSWRFTVEYSLTMQAYLVSAIHYKTNSAWGQLVTEHEIVTQPTEWLARDILSRLERELNRQP